MNAYETELFAMRTSLEDHVRFRGCSYESLTSWLSDMLNEELYELGIAMLSKSTIIRSHGNEELFIPTDESILGHLHLIHGAVMNRSVNIRIYGDDGYSKMNLFNGQITKLGLDKSRWTWYN